MSAVPAPVDLLHRFVIERSGVRGVLVRLEDAWTAIRERTPYPPSLSALLGQTVAGAALISGHSKIDGRLSIQMRGEGALRTLFGEYASGGRLRGIALWNDPLPERLGPREFGPGALLAITIETDPRGPREGTRYQGMVGLDAERLDQALEAYFAQSEQLPTRLLLAADGSRACGLMLQQLPGESRDPDGWTRAQAIFDTLGDAELLGTDPEVLLHRLFHEDGVQLLGTQPLHFGCACTRERVGAMLVSLGREEALAALTDSGSADIACEFCGQHYLFDRIDIEQLFAGGGSAPPGGPAH